MGDTLVSRDGFEKREIFTFIKGCAVCIILFVLRRLTHVVIGSCPLLFTRPWFLDRSPSLTIQSPVLQQYVVFSRFDFVISSAPCDTRAREMIFSPFIN